MKLLTISLAVLATITTVRADEDPLEPLNRRVGTWVNKNYQKKAAWTPEPGTVTGEETVKWVLDKKFLQGEVVSTRGKGLWLLNYDAETKVYRTWFFGSNPGEFPRGEAAGKWDPKKERMEWKMDFGGDLRGEMFFQFSGKDKMAWGLTIRDGTGKLMMDTGGTQTRKD